LFVVVVELIINIIYLYFIIDNVTAIHMFYSLSISYGVGSLLHIADRVIYNRDRVKNYIS
jgi:hypothetical protein